MGQAVIQGAIEEVLRFQFQRLGDHQLCPECGQGCHVGQRHEPFRFATGRSTTTSPSVVARLVAGIFFPHRPSLRLDSHHYSPAIIGKIARAAARGNSFRRARESLFDLAEVTISGRQVGRIAHVVESNYCCDRDQRVEDFQNQQAKPEQLPPAGRCIRRWRPTSNPLRGARPRFRHPRRRVARGQGRRPAHDDHPKPRRGSSPRTPPMLCKSTVVELVRGSSGKVAAADVIGRLTRNTRC